MSAMETFDFKNEVIEQSNTVPILVDFWAPWCAPCQFLGPIMEELEHEASGKWKLVKINTDEHKELMLEFGISSIPNIKLFYQGKVIAELAGALPKYLLFRWLEQYLPDERKLLLAIIESKLKETDRKEALAELQLFVTDNPDIPEARVLLAREKVIGDPQYARELISNILADNSSFQISEDIRSLADLLEYDEITFNKGSSLEETILKIKAAQIALEERNYEATLAYLIESIKLNKNFNNNLPRRASIAIFHILGDTHPLTKKYRRLFSTALY